MWKRLFFCCSAIICIIGGFSLQRRTAAEQSVAPTTQKPRLTLLMDWHPRAEYAGIIVAEEKGFFYDAGLGDVTLHWAYPGEATCPKLVSGDADFCCALLLEGIIERSKGTPIVELAQLVQASSIELVTKRTSGIERIEDINGHRIAMWNDDDDCGVRALFRERGIKPDMVPLSYSLAVFLRDAVDAVTVRHYSGYNTLLLSGLRPEDLRVFRMADYGYNLPEDSLFCLEDTLKQSPEKCKALVAAIHRGWVYAMAHEEETLDIVVSYCEKHDAITNRPHQRWMLREMKQLMHTPPDRPWGSLDRKAYYRVGDVLKSLKLIEKAAPYEEFYRPAINAASQPGVGKPSP